MNKKLNSFLNYIKHERRFSKHTLKSYEVDIKQFYNFIEKHYNLTQIKEANHIVIRSWIVSLKEKGISSRTINRKISTLKTFHKFLLKTGEIEVNPMLKVITPKVVKQLPTFFSNKKIKHIFEGNFFTNNFQGLRDALILDLLYSTGIRLSELVELKESDINKNQIKVLGKRNKERIIPITNRLHQIISKYLENKTQQSFKTTNTNLLVTNKGEKMYDKFVYRRVNHYIGLVTNEKKKSPHTLRHSFATNMLNNGAQLHSIKEILGHTSLAATQVYTHNSIARLKDIHKKYHTR